MTFALSTLTVDQLAALTLDQLASMTLDPLADYGAFTKSVAVVEQSSAMRLNRSCAQVVIVRSNVDKY